VVIVNDAEMVFKAHDAVKLDVEREVRIDAELKNTKEFGEDDNTFSSNDELEAFR
jgi:hypothetical protein